MAGKEEENYVDEEVKHTVGKLFESPEFCELFQKNWSFVALQLSIPTQKILRMREDLESNQIGIREVSTQILKDWVEAATTATAAERRRERRRADVNVGEMIINLDELISVLNTSGLAKFTDLLRNESPQEKVFANPLIIRKIFKMLRFQDRKSFRRMTRLCMTETLKIWRDTAVLWIVASPCERNTKATFNEFFKLFKKSSSLDVTFGDYVDADDSILQLMKYPFRRVNIHHLMLPFLELPTTIDENYIEKEFFWRYFGHQITHLQLQHCQFINHQCVNGFRWLVLEACPNLLRLEISGSEDTENLLPEAFHRDHEIFQNNCLVGFRGTAAVVPLVAEKLEELKFQVNYDTGENDNRKFLEILPNLKRLTVTAEGTYLLQGLPHPTANRNYIKLEKVLIHPGLPHDNQNFLILASYTAAFPRQMKSLSLLDVYLTPGEGVLPAEVHLAISQCKTLESLKLTVKWENDGWPEAFKWFRDFTALDFPHLKKLDLKFKYDAEENTLNFDFGALKQMPKLEELSISTTAGPQFFRNSFGMGTWFHANEDEDGYPELPPFRLENLKRFSYNGWILERVDVTFFGNLFPNLKHLRTGLHCRSLKQAFVAFPNLESLVLNFRSRVPLTAIAEAKRMNAGVKVKLGTKQCGEIEIMKMLLMTGEEGKGIAKELAGFSLDDDDEDEYAKILNGEKDDDEDYEEGDEDFIEDE